MAFRSLCAKECFRGPVSCAGSKASQEAKKGGKGGGFYFPVTAVQVNGLLQAAISSTGGRAVQFHCDWLLRHYTENWLPATYTNNVLRANLPRFL